MKVKFKDKSTVEISTDGFKEILQAFFVDRNLDDVFEQDEIHYSRLVSIAHEACIPLAVFFAPLDVISDLLDMRLKTILPRVPTELRVNSRGEFPINKLQIVIRDFAQKIDFLKRGSKINPKNEVYRLIKGSRNVEEAASKLRHIIGYDLEIVKKSTSHAEALEYLIAVCGKKNIFVARNQPDAMLKSVKGLGEFSGFLFYDKCYPYIYLAGGKTEDREEPIGRKMFTLALRLVSYGCGKTRYVQMKTGKIDRELPLEYEIASAFLMPQEEFSDFSSPTTETILNKAKELRVTPTALVVRCCRLGILTKPEANHFIKELQENAPDRFVPGGKKDTMRSIIRYASPSYLQRAFAVLDLNTNLKNEFSRVVCLNKVMPWNLEKLRGRLNDYE